MSDIFENDTEEEGEEELSELARREKTENLARAGGMVSVPPGAYKFRIPYLNEAAYAVPPDGMKLSAGDRVMIQTRFGADIAECVGPVPASGVARKDSVCRLIRLASDGDIDHAASLALREEEALGLFKQHIAARNLNMKAESVHFLAGEGKVIFFFTSDQRVDFRELVHDLVADFHLRIELRQLGDREVCRMFGGLGPCGRPFCCLCMNDRGHSVSIRSVKDQSISLTSSKVSGACGRLLCCLDYEEAWYREERKRFPRKGSTVYRGEEPCRVVSLNYVSGTISLRDTDGAYSDVSADRVAFSRNTWHVKDGEAQETEVQTEN